MSRKHGKGYYVDGKFVSADEAAREQLAEAEAPSRTARKHAAKELQDVGEQLLDLRPELLDALPVPDALREAVVDAKRITSFGARRRQLQLIGKLMRRLEPEALDAVRDTLRAQRRSSSA